MLEIRLLGQFDVRLNGAPVDIPSRPAQSLLARLVLTPGVAHRREKLAGELWPDTSDANARNNLRHALWRIRKALEPEPKDKGKYIVADGISIAFNSHSDFWLDARELERQVKATQTCTGALALAARLYEGELLPGVYDEWTDPHRMQLQLAFDSLMHKVLLRLRDEARWHEVVEMCGHWIARGESQEAAFRELMIAHRALGDVASMQADYRLLRVQMQRQFGVTPSDETQTLFEKLSKGWREVTRNDRVASERKQHARSAPDVFFVTPKVPGHAITGEVLLRHTTLDAMTTLDSMHFHESSTPPIDANGGLTTLACLPGLLAERQWRSTTPIAHERVAMTA